MSDDNANAAEELLQQSKDQRRHNSPAADSVDETDAASGRVDAIKDALVAIEAGDAPENINLRDARLKALLVGLDDAGELDAVAVELAEAADVDLDATNVSQSEVARLLMRIGLQETLPDMLEDATAANKQRAVEQASEF